MPMKNASNAETAKALFKWNSINLVSHANLKKSEISNFFAPNFIVEANGIRTEVTYDSYFKFLNNFRKNIKTINYKFQKFIIDNDLVVIPLRANIKVNDNSNKFFDAILILQFNKEHKIILWHEVYVLVKQS
jgi:hypothetical protein